MTHIFLCQSSSGGACPAQYSIGGFDGREFVCEEISIRGCVAEIIRIFVHVGRNSPRGYTGWAAMNKSHFRDAVLKRQNAESYMPCRGLGYGRYCARHHSRYNKSMRFLQLRDSEDRQLYFFPAEDAVCQFPYTCACREVHKEYGT